MNLRHRLERPRARWTLLLFASAFVATSASAQWVNMGGNAGGEGSTPFTALAQAPEANLFSGAMSTSIPIMIPPGRANATPELAVSYSSSGGESAFGYGWDLMLGSVERGTKHGVPSCSLTGGPGNSDEFVLNLRGATVELVAISGNLYRAKFDEAYVEAQKDTGNNQWVVYDRRGMTFRFGLSASARVFTGSDVFMTTSGGCKFTAAWALSQIEDPNGNIIDIAYDKVSNVPYPSAILYGANPSAAMPQHAFQVWFEWANRTIPVESNRHGVAESLTKVIDRIHVQYKQSPSQGSFDEVRTYDFTHTPNPDTARLLLTSVAVLDPAGAPLVPTQTFTYSSSDLVAYSPTSYPFPIGWVRETDPSDADPVNPGVIQTVMDMNGDGRMDVVRTGPGSWNVYYGTESGPSTTPTAWTLPANFPSPGLRKSTVLSGDTTTYFDTLDITGDGLPDMVDARTLPWKVFKGSCSGATTCRFLSSTNWSAPDFYLELTFQHSDPHKLYTVRQLFDINADGLPDLVNGDAGNNGAWTVYLNTGSGFAAQPWAGFAANGPLAQEDESGGRLEIAIMDFNGDGLPDRLQHTTVSGVDASGHTTGQTYSCSGLNSNQLSKAAVLSVQLNTGRSFGPAIYSATPYFVLPTDDHEISAMRYNRTSSGPKENRTLIDLIDVNSDGLPDWVYHDPNDWSQPHEWHVLLNQGDGRLEPLVVPAGPFSCGSPETNPAQQPTWPLVAEPPRYQLKDTDPGHWYTKRDLTDWNGDGLLDYVDTTGWNPSNNQNWQVWLSRYADGSTATRPGLLVKSDNGFGGVTHVRYEPSTHFAYVDPDEDPAAGLPFNTWVVTGIRRTDGLCTLTLPPSGDLFDPLVNGCIGAGHELVQQFAYADGLFHAASREFRGFGLVVETDADGNRRELEYSQENGTRGKLLRETLSARAGSSYAAVREKTYDWRTRPSLGRTQVYLAEERSEDFAAFTSSPPASQCLVTRNEPPDDYGRVTKSCSLACGLGTATAGQCSPAVLGQVETTTTWATPQSGSFVYDRPSHVQTSDYWQPPGMAAFSMQLVAKDFYYDGLALGAVSKGNVHRVSTPIATSMIGISGSADVLNTHDAFGNVTGTTDPNGHITLYIFNGSPFALYPASEWKADMSPAFQTARVTDLRFGKPTQITDENGAVTTRDYDALGRVTCEAGPGDWCSIYQPFEATASYFYGYGNPAASSWDGKLSFVQSGRYDPNASGGVVVSRTYVDGLGRLRFKTAQQVVGSATNSSTVISNQTDYDAQGRVARTFAPYVYTGGVIPQVPSTATTQLDYVLNGNSFGTRDPLGRVHSVTPPDGNVTTSFYEGSRTRVKDPRNNETWSMRDAFGHELLRERRSGSSTVEMSLEYFYDGLGRVYSTRTSNNNATITSTFYDGLGRVALRNDPDSGAWLYGYDRVGNLVYENDPKTNQHVQMCYDALDRIELRCTFPNEDYVANACATSCAGGTVESAYTYDESENGITRLSSVTDQSGSESFSYDERGRVVEDTKVVQGLTATTGFSFDDGDHLETTTYPDGEVVRNLYGLAGQLIGVEEEGGASIFVSDIDYDIFGRAQKITHGNGLSDTKSFYGASESFRLSGVQVAGASATQLNLQYSYNELGKIEHVQDLRNPTAPLSNTGAFTYDSLGRLTLANATSYYGPYTYDNIGNITQAGAGPLSYSGTKPHQVALRGLSLQVNHDANGNLTLKQNQADAVINNYDAMDRLVTSSFLNSSNQQTYKYDYTGRRVFRQQSGVAPERYFSKLVEFDGSLVTKYYYAGDRLVAARWVSDATFGTRAPVAAPIQIPPELPVAIGSVAFLLLLGFGRRERRIGVSLSPSRALGTALLVLASAPPVGLFSASPAHADCDPSFNVLHYHLDHLGSTQVVTDYQGAIQQQIRYSAYGTIRGHWDANGAPLTSNPAGLTREFTAYESDALTGFLYAGARYYDPDLGQFLSHDPSGQFPSPYAYGPGDPMNGTDPNGSVFGIDDAILIIVVAAALASIAYNAYQAVQAGAPIGSVVAQAVGQAVMLVATAAVLGPVTSALPFPAAAAVRVASIGYGTYNTVQAARDGDVAGAVASGVGTAAAAYGLSRNVYARASIGSTTQPANGAQETVSVVVEEPDPASDSKLGRLGMSGHSGIGVEDDYWDYGPQPSQGENPFGSEGRPWWDAFADTDGDASLSQVLDYAADKGYTLSVFTTQVSSEQAAAVRSYWNNLYSDPGTYHFAGRNCTTAVGASLRAAGLGSFRALTPSGLASQLRAAGWQEQIR